MSQTKRFEFKDARSEDYIDVAFFSQTRDAMNYARQLVARDEERPVKVIDDRGDFRVVRSDFVPSTDLRLLASRRSMLREKGVSR